MQNKDEFYNQSLRKQLIYEIKPYDNGRRVYTNRFDCRAEGGGGGASGSKEAAAKAYNYNHLLNQIPEPDEPVMKRHSCTLDNESVKDGRCYHDT